MSKILGTNEILNAVVESGVPDADLIVKGMEDHLQAVAESLAAHLGIRIKCPADWAGMEFDGLCVSFGPRHKDQACPGVIDDGDSSGDWAP